MHEYKVINDPIYGSIQIPKPCMEIIDTEEFQRLRHLHQLGLTYMVYPGATHTRFEHSIGVCHLAGQVICFLKNNQSELDITEEDVLCVMIAGLCHDLGHGPFSHAWETYMKTMNAEWKHEDVSIRILEDIFRKTNLLEKVEHYSLNANHVNIIRNMILGQEPVGEPSKAFLYQIVNNQGSGCDVDKWDYCLRDCHYLGLKSAFDYKRLILNMRVNKAGDDKNVLCFRDKEYFNIRELFQTRLMLHRKAYQHRFVRVLDYMLVEILKQFSMEIKTDWPQCCINAFNGNCGEYIKLTDSVVWNELRFCDNSKIQTLMKPLITHNKEHGILDAMESEIKVESKIDVNNLEENFEKFLQDNNCAIPRDDFVIQVTNLHWGKSNIDPLPFVNFYSKANPSQIFSYSYTSKSHQELKLLVIFKKHKITNEIQRLWSEFPNSKPAIN